MKLNGFRLGIMMPRPVSVERQSVISGIRIVLTAAALSIGVVSCDNSSRDSDSYDTVVSQPEVNAEDFDSQNGEFAADNDIAMTVRSVADAMNVGEPIDSVDYSFKGVLTDGSGMPLFTDMEGLPGEWQIDVLSPYVVQIRNVNAGDLMPDELMGYLSAALQLDDDDSLQLLSERESNDRKVSIFSFGRGTLAIETKPGEDTVGEAGNMMLITMRATQRPATPALLRDSARSEAVDASIADSNAPRQHSHNSRRASAVHNQRNLTRR